MYTSQKEIVGFFILFSLLLMLLLASIIIMVILKNQKKKLSYLNEIQVLKKAQENEILNTEVEIQEQTFQNISREIHDNIGQKLSWIKIRLADPIYDNDSTLNEVVDILGNVIADLRNLSRTLSSEIITDNGISEAIRLEIEQLRKANLFDLKFFVKGESLFLETNRELIVYRIFQEAMQNIIRHANASRVTVNICYTDSQFILDISDNGKGFGSEKKKGQGLVNMAGRAAILGGDLTIKSKLNEGTNISISIPLNKSNAA